MNEILVDIKYLKYKTRKIKCYIFSGFSNKHKWIEISKKTTWDERGGKIKMTYYKCKYCRIRKMTHWSQYPKVVNREYPY